MKRPTMKDIAREAGVSRGAASFALNDRPGVSEQTRARVKEVAARMGWTASPAALALSSQRARAVGMVIAREGDAFASEAFFLKLISGVERVLQAHGLSLVLHIVPDPAAELAALRNWWAEGRVDGVLLLDPRVADERPALLGELEMPGVVVGGRAPGGRLAGLETDDEGAIRAVVQHLHDQGHRRIAYVIGLGELAHTRDRSRGFREMAGRFGMDLVESGRTGFTEDAGRHETEALLGSPERPSAIVYDNEILAIGGLSAIHAAGLRCPDDVAIVSCEDSPLCRGVQPSVTALVRDPAALGEHATRLLVELVETGRVRHGVEPLPGLAVRASSVTP